MEINEFLHFINERAGMNLNASDICSDLSEVEEWDSLTFVYMIIEFENSNNIKLDVEKILACHTLSDMCEVINDEIRKNK